MPVNDSLNLGGWMSYFLNYLGFFFKTTFGAKKLCYSNSICETEKHSIPSA